MHQNSRFQQTKVMKSRTSLSFSFHGTCGTRTKKVLLHTMHVIWLGDACTRLDLVNGWRSACGKDISMSPTPHYESQMLVKNLTYKGNPVSFAHENGYKRGQSKHKIHKQIAQLNGNFHWTILVIQNILCFRECLDYTSQTKVCFSKVLRAFSTL